MRILTLLPLLLLNLSGFGQVTSFTIDDSQLNKSLAIQLDSIYGADQSTRIAFEQAKTAKKPASTIDSLKQIVIKTDLENLAKVNSIISKYGWLGPQIVGINGAQGLFLAIQHADLKTQEYYLPMIRAAEKKGEILSSNLAILEDRINVRNGKKQLYGSQGFTDKETGKKYIYPIEDIDGLDKRRAAMGMPPMSSYVRDWNPGVYKKDLPNIEQLAGRI